MMRPIRRAPVSQIVLEEIALEGLEGITLPSLWAYLSVDLKAPLPLASDVQNRVWNFIKRNTDQLEFYELPTGRPTVQLESRFSNVDPDFGVPMVPDIAKFPRYKYAPVEDGKIMGSCEYYKERKRIEDAEVSDLSVEATYDRWGNCFIIVASQDLRYCVLTPRYECIPRDLNLVQYCVWEAIGRSRYNGETTSGQYSISPMCKDSSVVFYTKNKLINLGLIVQQPYTEYRDDRLTVTSLLNLAQYVPDIPRSIVALVEKLYGLVKQAPDELLKLPELRAQVPPLSRKSTFRRLVQAPFFQRIFEIKKTKTIKTSGKNKEIHFLAIGLKNPDVPLSKLIEEIMVEEKIDEIDFKDAFVNNKHSFVDMPLKEEFYRAILRHGTQGCSHSELCSYLSETHSLLRQMVKAMLRDGLIVSHVIDEGRQRMQKFVAVEALNSTKSVEDKQINKSDDLIKFSSELPPVVSSEENYVGDCLEVETIIEDYTYKDKIFRITQTARQTKRRNFIVQQLNEHALLSTIILRSRLHQWEMEMGYRDEICFKSLRRIFMEMKKTDNLKAYEVSLKYQGSTRIYRYLAHPNIGQNHPLMQCELKRLRNMFLLIKDREQCKKINKKKVLRPSNVNSNTKKEATVAKSPLQSRRKPPKFLISRYMHEFLYYIVVELNEHREMLEIDENLLQTWKENEPSLQVQDFLQNLHAGNEVQHAYTQQLNWRTFIKPLPKYADKPAGWVFFMDAIERMPLSIFNKIFRFQQSESEKLNEYLTHPIRQHYLMRQLPLELQNQINRIYLQRICTMVLKVLHHMGLIQINDSANLKDSMMLWIYLNRRTQILDTTPSEARYAKINTARKYEELNFYFSTFDDVTMYWTQIHRICIFTKLGRRSAMHDEKSASVKEILFLPPVGFDEAPQHDTGEVPGDRTGAAGFAAFLFAHTIRNWSWVLRTNTNPKPLRPNRITLLRSTTSKNLRLMGIRKSRLLTSQIKRLQQPTTAGSTSKRYTKKKDSSIRDAIDCEALKNMRTLRVSWLKKEDDLLKIARAVYIYLAAPVPVLGLVAVGKVCRDVLKHNLGIHNKTTISCHRRLSYIVKMGRHIPEVPSWVHTLQTHRDIQKCYGHNFLERLKNIYPDREDFCEALLVHFIKLFYFLYQLIHNKEGDMKSFAVVRPRFMIPDTVDEFNRRFEKRVPAIEERCMVYTNPCNNNEALTMLAIGVLHSSLCSSHDKTTYTAQAFEIFKKFSEEILHNAYAIVRNGGMIVTNKRKNVDIMPTQLTSPAYSFSVHYQRRLNFLHIPYTTYNSYSEFFEKAIDVLLKPKEEFMELPSSSSKGQALTQIIELKSPHAGQLYFITEGLARNFWTCKIKLPINILTVDAENRQTLSPMDRILDHYHSIFDNAPEMEYAKNIDNESNEKQVHVKFHQANLSYKITYTPYDFISKLSARHLHFFCALDHLGNEVEINFSRLMRKDDEHNTLSIECPFNCILKHGNYINAIERIVQEKRSILNELSEMPPQKLLNMAINGCSMTVETSNLLTLVRMLESFWCEKETIYERKDLGRITGNLKVNKIIDWHQLCCDILEFNVRDEEDNDKIDEYEPTLNKEERLARAQDVFVVNLPTLQLEMNRDDGERVLHNGLYVPKRLVEAEIERDAILRKIVDESHWKYTDNTLEALKPKLIKLGFTVMEQQHVEDLLRYIESHKLGVPVANLLQEFPYAQFLSRALRILTEHYLVKRVGIATMMYVHKSNIRPWVIHTFHIKRLERENLGPDGLVDLKRRASPTGEEGDHDEAEEASCSKKPKLTTDNNTDSNQNQQMSKRIPKPVKRFQSESDNVKTNEQERKRDVIVMKPHPWLRLNGTINRRVLDRWLGTILTECISCTGSMVVDIYSKYNYLTPVEIMFLLEILCDLKCIHLTEMKKKKATILSSYEKIEENIVTELYDPHQTYVTAHGDALSRMSIFIGNKKYTTQFF